MPFAEVKKLCSENFTISVRIMRKLGQRADELETMPQGLEGRNYDNFLAARSARLQLLDMLQEFEKAISEFDPNQSNYAENLQKLSEWNQKCVETTRRLAENSQEKYGIEL